MTARLLSVAEVAAVLGCSPKTVRRRIAARELPAFRDGGLVRVREPALAAYIAARTFAVKHPDGSGRPVAGVSPASARISGRSGRTLFDEPDPLAPLARLERL